MTDLGVSLVLHQRRTKVNGRERCKNADGGYNWAICPTIAQCLAPLGVNDADAYAYANAFDYSQQPLPPIPG